MSATSTQPLLQVRHLKKYFPIRKGFFNKVVGHVRAVDDVNFYINEGETLGLVGESGCGKTHHLALHPARRRADQRRDFVPPRKRRGGRTSPSCRAGRCARCAARCR